MESTNPNPEQEKKETAVQEPKTDTAREDGDVLVVDMDDGREKPKGKQRAGGKVVSLGSRSLGLPPTLV